MKIEKVLFVRPPLLYDSRFGHEEPHPPIELLYLAAALKDRYSVALLDGMTSISQVEKFSENFNRAGMSDEDIKTAVLHENPQVICIGSMWVNQKSAFDYIAGFIKSIKPETVIIAGGLLPSSIPETICENKNIDYVIVGEGEKVLPELLEQLEQRRIEPIPGVMFRDNGKLVHERPVLIEPVDSINMPAYEIVNFENYSTAYTNGHVKARPFVGVLPSRGCTYNCTFCSLPNVTGRSHRHHSVERVIQELIHLKEDYGIREFHFYDANILNDPAFAKSLFRAMIEHKINTPWLPEAGFSIWEVNDELLELAVESGMYRIDLPIESGSKKVRVEIMKKDYYDKAKIKRIIHKSRSLGIERIYGYIMIGNPGEDKKTIQESLDTLNELDLDYKGVRMAKPFPNTRFYEICKEQGYLTRDFSYDDLWFSKPVIETEKFSTLYTNVIVQSDRALALKRLGIRGILQSVKSIFKSWGVAAGLMSIFNITKLYFHYKSLSIPFKSEKKVIVNNYVCDHLKSDFKS